MVTVENKQKTIILIAIAVLVIVAGVALWYWSASRRIEAPREPQTLTKELSPAEAKDTLGGQILGKTQNPLEGELPATNPFEKTETNPLKDIYRNPFE